jgi:hypothetical protein
MTLAQTNKPASTRSCATCLHWLENKLAVRNVRLVACCVELSADTMADDYCMSWTPDGLNAPKRTKMYQVEQAKPLRVYPSWEPREFVCDECGARFIAKPTTNKDGGMPRPRRFCGESCYRTWLKTHPTNKGSFKKGFEPWNKGVKGIRLSPATEFKKGNIPASYVPIGTVVIRDQHRGSDRKQAYIKVADPNAWKARALVNWEEHNGTLEKGLILWHKDGDSLNDDINNLEAITRAESLARIRKQLGFAGRSKAAKKIWSRKRKELSRMSANELHKLGYLSYCRICGKPSKKLNARCYKCGVDADPIEWTLSEDNMPSEFISSFAREAVVR